MSERFRFHEGSGNVPPSQPPQPQQYPYHYYQQYPPPPDYAAYYKRYEVQKGLKFIFIGLLFYLLAVFFDTLWIVTIYSMDVITFILAVAVIGSLTYACWFIFFVLTAIGIFILYHCRDSFSIKHRQYMRYTIMFLIAFIVVFVSELFAGGVVGFGPYYLGRIMYTVLTSISSILTIISSFLLVFVLFLPVYELSGARERDKLYIFASLAIAVIISYAILNSMIGVMATDASFRTYIFAELFLNLVRIAVWAIAAFTYYRLWQYAKYYAQDIPKDTPQLLPRPKPISDYVYKFYTRPVQAIVILAIVALILGSAQGAALASFMFRGDFVEFSREFEYEGEEEDQVLPDPYSTQSYLEEGQEEEYSYYITADVGSVEVILMWLDESVRYPRENQPDGFTVEITLGGKSRTASGESDSEGNGYIQLRLDVYELFLEGHDDVTVTVTMDYAGDVRGPVGLGIGPFSEADMGNEFSMTIRCI